MVTYGYLWLLMITYSYLLLLLVIGSYWWLLTEEFFYRRDAKALRTPK